MEWLWEGQGLEDHNWTNVDGMEFPLKGVNDLLLWTPPPCIPDVSLELMRKFCHQRPEFTYIIVVPKLMTYKSRNIVLNTFDFSFYMGVGLSYWPANMHESLLIGI